jgi:hypothetical protein
MMTSGYGREFTRIRQSGGAGAVFLATLLGFVAWSGVAVAKGPGCTKEDIQKAANSSPEKEREKNLQSIEAKLAECKGRLTAVEEAGALTYMYFDYLLEPVDFEGCRRTMGRGIQLGQVSGFADFSDNWGYCGGDCSKAPMPDACRRGAKERELELNAKVGPDVEKEQPVPCNLTQARKLISSMDQAFFQDQALRFIEKYRADCKQAAAPAAKLALANDEALVHFHKDDDAACLHALDAAVPTEPHDVETFAFNRALCGGACTLDASQCASAAELRKKALEARRVRTRLRARMQEHCWDCKEGQACKPWPRDAVTRSGGSTAMAWNLKAVRHLGLRGALSPVKLLWAGDLNGDGLGDFVYSTRETHRDVSNAGVDGYGEKPFRYLDFRAWLSCGALGQYLNSVILQTDHPPFTNGTYDLKPDEYSLGIMDRPKSTIKSICVYPTRRVKCTRTKCDEDAVECEDFSDWENIERAAQPH